MKFLFKLTILLCCSQLAFNQSKGEFKEYFEKGQLKTEGQYFNKKRVGEWKNYFENGQVSRIYSYNNGEQNKEDSSYFENGTLNTKTVKQGKYYVTKGYYESGELYYERLYKDGYYKEFLKDGSLKIESNYLDYQLSGIWKRYYDNGKLEWSVEYEDGYRNGVYKNFNKNGLLITEGNISKERLKGVENRYSETGILEWKGYYKDGAFNKTWTRFDANGNKVEKVKFDKGIADSVNKGNIKLTPTRVPDGLIEEVPLFPGCEEVFGNKARKNCLSKNVSFFVIKNFNTDLGVDLSLVGKLKIIVLFTINEKGKVVKIQSRAPHPILQREAIRVIELLPIIKPGTQRGKPVRVSFMLPIVFQTK